jgi:hypothetical protein
MATRMTAAGLVTRVRDDRDNRLVRLWLTDAGRALCEPLEAERRELEEKVTADLTRAERQHLISALAKIHRSASDLLSGSVAGEPGGSVVAEDHDAVLDVLDNRSGNHTTG